MSPKEEEHPLDAGQRTSRSSLPQQQYLQRYFGSRVSTAHVTVGIVLAQIAGLSAIDVPIEEVES